MSSFHNQFIKSSQVEAPFVSPQFLLHVLKTCEVNFRVAAVNHANATPEVLLYAIKNDDSWIVRRSAVLNPSCTPEVLNVAIFDSDSWVRIAAVEHPNTTPLVILAAMEDSDPEVVEDLMSMRPQLRDPLYILSLYAQKESQNP